MKVILYLVALGAIKVAMAADPSPAPPLAAVYQRVTNHFETVHFFKPAEVHTEELSFKLAPLILQELAPPHRDIASGNGSQEGDQLRLNSGISGKAHNGLGSLSESNDSILVNASQPTLYTELDTVQIQGSIHPRLTYLWYYASNELQQGQVALQGIRLTLNSAGQPVVWEVLTDESGNELIFVAESLEAAARAEHGQPLPGRHYAIERGLEETPKVVVARVIDDGPMPMGPMVYLQAGTHSVSTVICRCMPAQAKTVAATRTYDLAPAQAAFSHSLVARARAQARGKVAFWPGEKAGEKRLEQRLRLPAKF